MNVALVVVNIRADVLCTTRNATFNHIYRKN